MASRKAGFNQGQGLLTTNSAFQDIEKHVVFERIKTLRNIALDKPDSTLEFVVNHLLGRMTPFPGTKPVGIFKEERFIQALENHFHCFLNYFLSRVSNL